MPLPTPREEEAQSDFISRCMGNSEMVSEFADPAQRRAVCHRQWEDRGAADASQSSGDGGAGRSETTNVYPMARARLGDHPSGLSRRTGVVGALSYPATLERAWRNWGWPFWADD